MEQYNARQTGFFKHSISVSHQTVFRLKYFYLVRVYGRSLQPYETEHNEEMPLLVHLYGIAKFRSHRM